MPIKPENKRRYPDNWQQIRQEIRERANDRCEGCGVVNHAYINRHTRELCLPDEDDTIRVVCTVAHLDHVPENNDKNNLRFYCQKCHNNHDIPHRKKTRAKTKKDNLIKSGQKSLNL